MSIVIFGDLFSFPEGSAATNRVYTYAKGFKENGIEVHIIVFSSVYQDVHYGTVDGISYYHPFQQNKRSHSFFVRRWQNFMKYVRTYRILRKINKRDRIIAINSWTNLLLTHFVGWIMAKLVRTKLVPEISEHPFREHQGGAIKRKKGAIKFYLESRFCDGILCISRFLVDFHKDRGVKQRKLFLIPSTVDPSRFIQNGSKPIEGPYVGYFGSLSFKRDSVDVLIKAFARFTRQHPDVKLVLGGFCPEGAREEISELIRQLNISDRVKVVEYLARQEVLKYITHADVLVMARSKDLESMASYPSKLTEFLATGKPVVTVDVGEITDFLTDNQNAYVVEPGNDEAMAGKLEFIFNNYEQARQVGLRGKELTNNVFHYNYQARRLIAFFQSLSN